MGKSNVVLYLRYVVKLLGVVYLLLFIGCAAPAKGPEYAPESTPDSDESLLYIYRPYVTDLSIEESLFLLNAKPIAELRAGGYSAIKLPAGSYEVVHTWAPLKERGRITDLTLKIKLQPGRIHYVELFVTHYPAGPVVFLKEVDVTVALQKIMACKKQVFDEGKYKNH